MAVQIDGDTAQAIMYDVAAERSEKESSLKYDGQMREFRAEVEKEWAAWQKDHPGAELYVPPELPPAGKGKAKGNKIMEAWAAAGEVIAEQLAEADSSDKPGDTKDGLPRSSFAYAPDGDPATWKLPYLTKDGAPDTAHLAAAAAAVSSGGFRGQKVDIPADAMASVKAKLRQAYKRAGKGPADMPESIRESSRSEFEAAHGLAPGSRLAYVNRPPGEPWYVAELLGAEVGVGLDVQPRRFDPATDQAIYEATPDYVLELIAEEAMQPLYVVEALIEARLGEAAAGDHFYGAWKGGSAGKGGGPAGRAMIEKPKGAAGSAERADAVGKSMTAIPENALRGPVLGPDGRVYAGPPGKPPFVARSMSQITGGTT